jgi:hypothetical protein
MNQRKKTFDGGRALLIGIGEGYCASLQLPRMVRQDAEAVGKVLRDSAICGYPDSQVRLLLDKDATKNNIVAALQELATLSRPDDTVILFFSGHGGRKGSEPDSLGYLCPADYVQGDPDGTGLGTDELTSLVQAIPAARVVLLLDACHAEAAAHVKAEDDHKGMLPGFREPALDKLSAGIGRVVIASCRETEQSWTSSLRGNSLFTHFLLEGLRGDVRGPDDGTIRVLDLFTYLSEQVPAHPVKGNVQHPVMRTRVESNFPLALRKGGWFKSGDVGGAISVNAPPSRPNAGPIDWRRFEQIMVQLYPTGPNHDELWSRAGGDVSALSAAGNGRAAWHASLRMLANGGGGAGITMRRLLDTALDEYPGNGELAALAD